MDRWRWCAALVAALVLACAGCDGAFKSPGRVAGGTGSQEFSFEYADGTTEATVVVGAPVVVELALPSIGFRRAADPDAGVVDATRLAVATSVDLGDPLAGGIEAGSDVAPLLAAAGLLQVTRAADGRPVIAITLDDDGLAPFPFGRMLWSVVVLDDIDRPSDALFVGLTVVAPDRPTAVVTLEIPPFGSTAPTGLSLPLDDAGVPFAGETLDFVLSVRAIPNVASGARFDRFFEGGPIDPSRISLTADRDLGDPANGGFFAGENFAALLGVGLDVFVDEQTGETIVALLFPLGGSFPPPLGETTFKVTLLDDADVASFESAALLRVVDRVTLSADVQPILSSNCATGSCHDNLAPAAGMRLTVGRTFNNTVRVRSGQTPDDSCATDRIEPYSLAASYLWHKVMDTHSGGCVQGAGSPMPPGSSLTPAEIAALEAWIEQGAHAQ